MSIEARIDEAIAKAAAREEARGKKAKTKADAELLQAIKDLRSDIKDLRAEMKKRASTPTKIDFVTDKEGEITGAVLH